MQLIRDSSQRIEAYNEGLVVFLYDDASSANIDKANPTILEGFGEDDAKDKCLAELAKSGTLVVFELEQDDELAIELAVGDPMSHEELAGGHWLAPQQARLHLPSGELRIENYNNLQFDEYAEDEEPAPRVSLPAGDYKLTLYRRDIYRYETEDAEPPQALHVITLTPDAGPTVNVSCAMLRAQSLSDSWSVST